MTIDEKRLVELCQQAAKEKNSKKAACIPSRSTAYWRPRVKHGRVPERWQV